MQGFRLIRGGYRREIAGLKHPPVQSFLKHDTPTLIQEQEDIDVSNVERVVSQLGADVIRVMTPHEIVSPVPVGIITSHDRQSRLLIVQFILETVNVLACIVTFQPRETVQQSKAGSQINGSQEGAQGQGRIEQYLLPNRHRQDPGTNLARPRNLWFQNGKRPVLLISCFANSPSGFRGPKPRQDV